jgi:signal transduction histidine kinase
MLEVLALAAGAVSLACGARLSLPFGVAAVAGLALPLAIAGGSIVPALLVTVSPWAAGRLVHSRGRLVAELAERNRALEAEQAAVAELAVRRERARIARDLHDIVGHHLAVMVIQAGAGRLDAPDAPARFARIRDAGGEALNELERLVELLQTDHVPRNLEALLRQARAAGVDLHYTPLPAGVQFSPEVREGAYRVVQEGLTNAIKHAAGSDVLVRLGVHERALEVEVRDSGSAAPSPLARSGAGLGLAGMRERVEALGGELEAGPLGTGGWCVHATLPLEVGHGMP